MKNPYSSMTNEKLSEIYKDYIVSKNEGRRCEMQIKVTDLHNISGKIYGYCTCGREVTYGKHTVCPVCGAKLVWSIPKKGVVVNE